MTRSGTAWERSDLGSSSREASCRGVVHQLEVLPDGELVVLSFHTVPEEDLLEVSAAGERTYTDPAET